MNEVDIAIIGAGVVGLAAAVRLARNGHSVVVLEKERREGTGTSSRNSGVIHAGLYYPPGSLKAELCVEGRDRLYAYARARGVAHARTGKLVVASDDAELVALDALHRRAEQNGAGPISTLTASALRRLEPALTGTAALVSPHSGIIDVHELMRALRAEAVGLGADFAFNTKVIEVSTSPRPGGPHQLVTETADHERFTLFCRRFLNAAGLHADRLAERTGVDIDAQGLRQVLVKGDYFVLREAHAPRPRAALVYPVPRADRHGLGIHLTRDLGGRVRVGPDATEIAREDYDVDGSKADAFACAVGRYLKGLRREHLSADFAGIRPSRRAASQTAASQESDAPHERNPRDFALHEEPIGALHLVGIDSPGLTAALAIAERIAAWARRGLG